MSQFNPRGNILMIDPVGMIPSDISTESITIPAGAAGAVVNFYSTKKPVLDSNKSWVGGNGDTTLSLTSTAFDTQVAPGTLDADLSNGEYWFDHLVGKGRGKKKDGSTTMTANYSVFVRSGLTGVVIGPASSTDHAIARFDGTTGKLIQDSSVIIDDANSITGVVNLTMTGDLQVDGNFIFGDATTDVLTINGQLFMGDDIEFTLGNTAAAPDVRLLWETVDTDAHYLNLIIGTSRNFIISEDAGIDWGHAASTNPTLFIQSADSGTTADWISLAHDQTDAIIESGAGDIVLKPAGGDIRVGTRGNKIDLSGDGGEYITSDANNQLNLYAGSGERLQILNTAINSLIDFKPSSGSTWTLGNINDGWKQIYCEFNSLGATTADADLGVLITNNTDATAGAQQYSPTIVLEGQGWKTTATAASQEVQFALQTVPVQGTTNPTGDLTVFQNINDAGFSALWKFNSGGDFVTATRGNKLDVSGDGGEYIHSPNDNAISIVTGGSARWDINVATVSHQMNNIGTTLTDADRAYIIVNNTDAQVGFQQFSPVWMLEGQGWKTNATAESQEVQMGLQLQTVQGTANPSGNLVIFENINEGGYNKLVTFQSGGNVGIGTSAPLGKLQITNTTGFDLIAGTATGQDNILLINGANSGGAGNYGPGISFGFPTNGTNIRRYASVASVQTSANANHIGLAFITHPGNLSADALEEKVRITHDGKVGIGTDNPTEKLQIAGGNVEIYDKGTLAGESLQDGNFSAFGNWDEVGDFAEGVNNYVYTHSGGTGTLTQQEANLTITGQSDSWYVFTYVISSSSGDAAATLTTGFAESAVTLTISDGAQSVTFKSKANPADFVISGTSSSGGFTIDDVSLKKVTGGHIQVHGQTKVSSGSTSFPGIAWVDEAGNFDTGFYLPAANNIGFVVVGSEIMRLSGSQFFMLNATGPALLSESSTATNPTFIPDRSELTSGIGGTSDGVSIITSGTERISIKSTGQIGIGVAPLTNMVAGDAVLEGGSLVLKEIATPTADANYGKVYNKSDNKMYFQDGAGVEHQIILQSGGEMYLNGNAVAQQVETANTDILLLNFTQGALEGNFTFDAGGTSGVANAISVFADYSGTVAGTVLATDVGHGLSTGDIISIRGTTNYNGVFEITVVGVDTFYFTVAWNGDDGTGDWDQGSSLVAGASDDGDYDLKWTLSGTPAAGTPTVLVSIYKNATLIASSKGQRKFANAVDIGSFSGICHIDGIVSGDIITIAMQGDATNNMTYTYGGVNLSRH